MASDAKSSSGSTAPLSGTRAQRVQRLQIGLFGLGGMILMVGLANIIMNSAQENQAAIIAEDEPAVAIEDVPPPPPRDPLADAGVVPEIPAEPEPLGDPAANALEQGNSEGLPLAPAQ